MIMQIEQYQKTICHQIIHDADCLDIIRARTSFNAAYLDFYKHKAKDDPLAFNEQSQLICEARSIINHGGDTWGRLDASKKTEYEREHCFQRIRQDIESGDYPILGALSGALHSKEQLTDMVLVDLPCKILYLV